MDYQQIIEKLKEQGKITDEDIKGVIDLEESEIRSFATLLHSLMCIEKHISLEEHAIGMEGCAFYAEEQMNNTWELLKHKKWLDAARAISEHTSLMSQDRELIVRICSAIATREEYIGLYDSVYIELSKARLTKQEY